MKTIINVLDSSVYNHIAAGEVVERPASVVKELVENSIDAHSSQIDVEIESGGTKKIKVSDNGTGIDSEFIKTAFLPHATSKVCKTEDLDNILTLGFRGEALASIAAVSKVAMTSKTEEEEVASAIEIEGGKVVKEYQTGRMTGTTTIVSDLFFNVPARKKFLKKDKSEEQEITALMSRFILSHPEISFSYKADGKLIYTSSGTNLKDALFAIYGKEAISETLETNLEKNGLKVWGYIGRPSFSKPNRTYQTLVINGRYVVNNTISLAITNAFGEMLMKRKYPFFVMHLSIPAGKVDVNVHPNKLDVRFENTSQIYSLFYEAISRALDCMDYVTTADDKSIEKAIDKVQTDNILGTLNSIDQNQDITIDQKINMPVYLSDLDKKPTSKIDKAGVNLNPFSKDVKNLSNDEKQALKDNIFSSAMQNQESSAFGDGFGLGSKLLERLSDTKDNKRFNSNSYTRDNELAQACLELAPTIKKVGKIFNTYLLVEVDDDLFFIDQHAAHERVLYEKFKTDYDHKTLTIQPLLFPYVLSLSPQESNILDENLSLINDLGFELEEFGRGTYKLSAVPAIVSEMNFDKFFDDFLSGSKNIAKKSSELIKDYLMQHSCKSAIKGGDDLNENEINELYQQMNNQKITLFCPHGRPIAIRVTKNEVEKWFKRIV